MFQLFNLRISSQNCLLMLNHEFWFCSRHPSWSFWPWEACDGLSSESAVVSLKSTPFCKTCTASGSTLKRTFVSTLYWNGRTCNVFLSWFCSTNSFGRFGKKFLCWLFSWRLMKKESKCLTKIKKLYQDWSNWTHLMPTTNFEVSNKKNSWSINIYTYDSFEF